VWVGAALTALLFTVGKFALGLYLGKGDVGSAYGAAGSLVILLVWVYYSAQIFLFGAEFTQVYAKAGGRQIAPAEDATVTDPQKATDPATSSATGTALGASVPAAASLHNPKRTESIPSYRGNREVPLAGAERWVGAAMLGLWLVQLFRPRKKKPVGQGT
jgi:hypothetical protein